MGGFRFWHPTGFQAQMMYLELGDGRMVWKLSGRKNDCSLVSSDEVGVDGNLLGFSVLFHDSIFTDSFTIKDTREIVDRFLVGSFQGQVKYHLVDWKLVCFPLFTKGTKDLIISGFSFRPFWGSGFAGSGRRGWVLGGESLHLNIGGRGGSSSVYDKQ